MQGSSRRPAGATVLVVEDEPLVRKFTRRCLELLGYAVLEADSGAAALAVVELNAAPVDLILSDVVMPGLSAWEMAKAVERVRPDIRVIFMSAYPSEVVAGRGLLGPGAPFLQKPFSLQQLAACLGGLVDSTRSSTSAR